MDYRRISLWAVLVVSLFVMWQNWMMMSAKNQAQKASASVSATVKANENSTVPSVSANASNTVVNATGAASVANLPAGNGVDGLKPSGEVISVKTDLYEARFSTQGGQLQYLALLTHKDSQDPTQPVILFDTQKHLYLMQSGVIAAQGAPTHKTTFSVVQNDLDFNPVSNVRSLTLHASEGGIALTRQYQFTRGSYAITQTDTIKNIGTATVTPTVYYQLLRDDSYPDGKPSMFSSTTYVGPSFYSDNEKFHKVSFEDIAKGNEKNSRKLAQNESGWIAMIQHYFVAALITPPQAREFITKKISDHVFSVLTLLPLPTLVSGAEKIEKVTLYAGPQDSTMLEAQAPGLELVKDYGWLTVIAKPIFWLLALIHSGLGNWGWSIIVLTLLLKGVFYPLSAASYKSMARMKSVAPKMQALRERHGEDKMKLNQAMMELYKTEKINPLGGCLPIVVQIPVFISLYWVLLASAEMRGAPWLGWIHNLSAPDPYYILPVIMAASMFVQSKLNPPPPDPMQAKLMLYMPLVFSIFFFFFPAGLVLYWVVNNLVSIAQQWVITKRYAT